MTLLKFAILHTLCLLDYHILYEIQNPISYDTMDIIFDIHI